MSDKIDSPQRPRLQFQRYLITGLLTLFPLWLTWIVFGFILGVLSGVSTPWVHGWLDRLAAGSPFALGWLAQSWVQYVLAVLITLAVIYLVGFTADRMVGRRLIGGVEALIGRIPGVQQIYGGAKKLLEMMYTKGETGQRVVLIEFPHPGMKTLGIVTRVFKDAGDGRQLAAVYVPTAPNPTSGYLEIVPVESLTPTDWTMDQAMAFVVSGGAISPESITYNARPLPPGDTGDAKP